MNLSELNKPTEEHQKPQTKESYATFPALIMVFPETRAIVLGARGTGEVRGRQWLAEHGRVDTQVSGKHFEVRKTDAGEIEIRDVGSTNGTWLDGDKLLPGDWHQLQEQDVIRIGNTLFVYRRKFTGPLEPSSPSVYETSGQTIRFVAPFGLRHLLPTVQMLDERVESVLIEGETGTGKEPLARLVHEKVRPGRSYIAINMAAVPPSTFESHMFGYVRGAFTGGDPRGAPGVFEAYGGGTVFLDELGELPRELQPKLLRLLEQREVQRIGARQVKNVDVLIVAATNRNLGEEANRGTFRRDLLARFPVRFRLLPLRERREDLLSILWERARVEGVTVRVDMVSVEAAERILLCDWPDNVRGLNSLLSTGKYGSPNDPLALSVVKRFVAERRAVALERSSRSSVQERSSRQIVPTLTRQQVEEALHQAGGVKAQAAELLGISRQALYRLLKKMSIEGSVR